MKHLPITLLSIFLLTFVKGYACPPTEESIEPKEAPKPAAGEILPVKKPEDSRRFPQHWGQPPKIQTRDMVKLPGKWGRGSSTLAKWIAENLKRDAEEDRKSVQELKPKPKPPARSEPPAEAKEKLVEKKQATKGSGAPLPHFLVWGGGYSASGNQVSLEKNVLYFRRVLGELNLLKSPRHLLFADGRDKGRDLQFMDPAFDIPEINRAFAELLGSTKGIANQYRSNGLAPNGPSSLAEIDKWLNATASKLTKEDRLMIYFTGHGGKGDKKTPQNTNLYMWNNQKFKMNDFSKRLDKIPAEVPVVMVMVQCYSGGFANFIFKEGDPKKGMADHSRAGFFATVHDRVAAGCTPDIREENYQEYSTNFWEALCGKNRLGAKVEKPDFNGDGKISYAEAHAHVIISSETIDIPIKTSDAFLRHYSKTSRPKDAKTPADAWMKPDADYAGILKQASPEDHAVLEALSRKLGLKEKQADKRSKEARDLMAELEKQRKALADQKKKSDTERNKIKAKLAGEIRKRWPEVSNPFHPNARMLLEPTQSEQVMALLKKEGAWNKYLKAKSASAAFEKKRFELDKRKVKCMRFLRVMENVVLEKNLEVAAGAEISARYKKLRALENGSLSSNEPGA